MANYGIKLPSADITAEYVTTTSALSQVQIEHDQHAAALQTFAKDATLSKAQLRAHVEKERDTRGNKLLGIAGNIRAVEQRAASWKTLDDVKRIAEGAQFLPPIVDGESSAADLRRQAARNEVLAYREKLAHWDAERLAEEAQDITREAGDKPHESNALARLRELDWFAKSLSGPDATRIRSAVGSAWTNIEAGWKELNDLRAKRDSILSAADEIAERVNAVRSGRPSPRVQYFDWRRRNRQAA